MRYLLCYVGTQHLKISFIESCRYKTNNDKKRKVRWIKFHSKLFYIEFIRDFIKIDFRFFLLNLSYVII